MTFDPEAVQSVTKDDIVEAIWKALNFNEDGEVTKVETVLHELLEKFDD